MCAGQSTVQIKNHAAVISSVSDSMIKIPAGTYKAFLKKDSLKTIEVKAFLLGKYAVTNADFLQFVKAHPQWAKTKASPLYCDENYLRQWKSDLDIGDNRLLNTPVTDISWFAAQAYCKWKGGRLPTLNEWEYAALAPPENISVSSMDKLILSWYSKPNDAIPQSVGAVYKNKFGLYDMFGLVWEWVYDFNSVMLQGDSRTGQEKEKNLFCGTGSLNAEDSRNYAAYMRYAFRNSLKGNYTVRNLGFRVAKDYQTGK
jgi:formylglycine-generating enzyme required for sulfatase activity